MSVPIEGSDEVVVSFVLDPGTWFVTWQSLRNVVENA